MRVVQGAAGLFLLLLPFSHFFAWGEPASPRVLPLYVTGGLELSEVGALLLLVAALPHLMRRRALPHRAKPLLFPLLALTLLAFLTLPWAVSPPLAAQAALRWALAIGVYLALLHPALPLERMVPIFLAGLALQTLVGVGQVLIQGPLGLPGELALEPTVGGAAILSVGGLRWLRPYGLTFHPNILGGFLAVGLLLGMPLLKSWWARGLWWWLAVGLLLSFSRSAWLGFALLLLPLAAWLTRRYPDGRRGLTVTLGAALLGGLLLSLPLAGHLLSRFSPSASSSESRSLDERAVLLVVAWDLIREHPLAGVGASNFPLAMDAEGYALVPQPVHNVTLLLAAEVGLLGGALWLWLWFVPLATFDLAASRWVPACLAAWLLLCIVALWDGYPWVFGAGRLLCVTVLAWATRAGEDEGVRGVRG